MYLFGSILLLLVVLALIANAYRISTLVLYPPRQPISRTPADYGLAYEDISFASKDGLLLHGWWLPGRANALTHDPDPVVLILHPHFGNRHGLCTERQGWLPISENDLDLLLVAQAFHQAGYAVLMFDFRSHGESPRGLCAGGFTEDQDVLGAVDYLFQRVAPDNLERPKVGVIGFGLGAAATLVALGREKGGADVIRVFSGDSEGGSGFLAIQPLSVKRLRFLVAVQPDALKTAVSAILRTRIGACGLFLRPMVDLFCQWRGGFPLSATALDRFVGEAHIPLLYIHTNADSQTESGDIQRLYDLTPGPKQICRLDNLMGAHGTYLHVVSQLDPVLAFAAQQVNQP